MLEFNRNNIIEYAERYDKCYKAPDESVEREIKELLKNRKYLSREEFIKIGCWKSKRPKKHYEQNDDSTVKEITQFYFNTKNEQARIKSLFVLSGVSYPLASVILHFAFPDKYPILDTRALWSLGWQAKSYNFDFWQKVL